MTEIVTRLMKEAEFFPSLKLLREAAETIARQDAEIAGLKAGGDARKAADAILGRVTMELGAYLYDDPDTDLVPLLAEKGVQITGKMFMDLYKATDDIPPLKPLTTSNGREGGDGWKLVPIEPTIEMCRAAYAANPTTLNMKAAYQAMLSSSPPPVPEEGKADEIKRPIEDCQFQSKRLARFVIGPDQSSADVAFAINALDTASRLLSSTSPQPAWTEAELREVLMEELIKIGFGPMWARNLTKELRGEGVARISEDYRDISKAALSALNRVAKGKI